MFSHALPPFDEAIPSSLKALCFYVETFAFFGDTSHLDDTNDQGDTAYKKDACASKCQCVVGVTTIRIGREDDT